SEEPILTDGLFCVSALQIWSVALPYLACRPDRRSASGRPHHCRMAALPYPACCQDEALW
ncbi:hypothetical protein ACR58A_15815, partial [Citrobacter amalonaticus]|uniref:hypothetical protein n=1 Tax=Citrobacter amalonaticus TaxID=35703 RepID=UPI0038390556